LSAVKLTPLTAGKVVNLASGIVPDVSCVALSAVKFTPLDAGIVAGGVSVEALMSSVAPLGIETVSPDVPISRAVPLWGSNLSTLNTDAIIYSSFNFQFNYDSFNELTSKLLSVVITGILVV